MLVLSRRAEQRIVFPHLGITVKVLKVSGRLVKIGVEAPRTIKIVRPEVQGDDGCESSVETEELQADTDRCHEFRNQLNSVVLRLQAMQLQLDRGAAEEAEKVLESLIAATSAIDHLVAPEPARRHVSESTRPTRLLVVEDCDNERRLMAYLLATSGFDVTVARDGLEALAQLRTSGELPDFVLMDMQMPLAGGLETLLEIRQDRRLSELKVFAVTGTRREADLEPVGRGWDGWFQKPLDMGAILKTLRAGASAEAQLAT